MYFSDTIIDSVQNAKKNFVNSVVTNDKFKESWVKFIDTQTTYTKEAISNFSGLTTSLSLHLFSETSKAVTDMAKFEWFKKDAKSK